TRFNLARSGIALYGLWPSQKTHKRLPRITIKPVLSWKSRIANVRTVPTGTGVSYGLTFTTRRPSKLALIPVGYADGYDRHLSNKGHVVIRGKRCPIIGRVCMNMFVVDVTDLPIVKREDEVVLIGRQGNTEVTADELADLLGTINYEVVARLSALLPRIIVP
ncbi:MAG: alanine racemase, partial [bacterium]|nr:alanine racemase [bacterium]